MVTPRAVCRLPMQLALIFSRDGLPDVGRACGSAPRDGTPSMVRGWLGDGGGDLSAAVSVRAVLGLNTVTEDLACRFGSTTPGSCPRRR